MLNKKEIIKNPKNTKEKLMLKGYNFDYVKFINLEKERKNMQQELENTQHIKKKNAQQFVINKKTNQSVINLEKEGIQLNQKIKEIQIKTTILNAEILNILLEMPNIPDELCPEGNSEEFNIEVKKFKEPTVFDFEIKDHVEIGDNKKELDFETATKITKNRFVIMKNKIAKLHRALIQLMLNTHTKNDKYIEYNLPVLVNKKALIGTGQLPKFSEELYKVENEDLYLIPTGEVPLTNLFADTILKEETLPLKVTAHTQCFRSEAGAYGKDTKGMIRQHQFEKIELVQVVKEENAENALNEILQDAENILVLLDIPYRVVELCHGDLGFGAKKTFDIEVWVPSQNTYREISSCTWFGDFQARRLNCKWKNGKQKGFVNTVNGSGLAVGRTIVAVLENYQTKDGNVKIPEVLRAFFDNEEFLF
jgi:seryl-tRNA synthetase